MTGRRVKDKEDLAKRGDYWVVYAADGEDLEVAALWVLLPRTGTQGRIPAVGHGHVVDGVLEPEWNIVENSSGTVTVTPSIDERAGGYHGYLTDGVWSEG